MNSVECRPVGSSDVARIDIRAFHGRRSAARIGDSSGARPNRSPCTVAEGDGRRSWRGETASGLRRNAPTIEPADVPTTRSAALASYPRSARARSTPRWKASPVSPPAPRTRPILLTETCFPVAAPRIHRSAVVPGPGDACGVDELTDDPRRVAGNERVVGDVPADDRAGGYKTAPADRHAGQDYRPRTDPGSVTD